MNGFVSMPFLSFPSLSEQVSFEVFFFLTGTGSSSSSSSLTGTTMRFLFFVATFTILKQFNELLH